MNDYSQNGCVTGHVTSLNFRK